MVFDNRDIIKWGVLTRLAEDHQATSILQVAYLRPHLWPAIDINGTSYPVPEPVLQHFRDIRRSLEPWRDRISYHQRVLECIKELPGPTRIVFLDPDTGLEPHGGGKYEHVLEAEAHAVWGSLLEGDLFVLYQHRTNRNNEPWIEPKRNQLASALRLDSSTIGIAQSVGIANDVVLFFAKR